MGLLHACLCSRQEMYAEAPQGGTVSAEMDFSESYWHGEKATNAGLTCFPPFRRSTPATCLLSIPKLVQQVWS